MIGATVWVLREESYYNVRNENKYHNYKNTTTLFSDFKKATKALKDRMTFYATKHKMFDNNGHIIAFDNYIENCEDIETKEKFMEIREFLEKLFLQKYLPQKLSSFEFGDTNVRGRLVTKRDAMLQVRGTNEGLSVGCNPIICTNAYSFNDRSTKYFCYLEDLFFKNQDVFSHIFLDLEEKRIDDFNPTEPSKHKIFNWIPHAQIDLPPKSKNLFFGSYPQDLNSTNDKPIEWIVLDKQEDKMLIMSRFCLVNKFYSESGNDPSWENSTVRSWLNTQFYENAFSNDEKNKIIQIDLNNGDFPSTKDRIFLLSEQEIKEYFTNRDWLLAETTPYADGSEDNYRLRISQGLSVNWWLRVVSKRDDYTAKEAKQVYSGYLPSPCHSESNDVMRKHGETRLYFSNGFEFGVRPTMWIATV
ncbi:MAG: hypothetical protein IKA02_01220 [Clostridia bacterium]|nr:hypothetical protein [Clostridia bacterium]